MISQTAAGASSESTLSVRRRYSRPSRGRLVQEARSALAVSQSRDVRRARSARSSRCSSSCATLSSHGPAGFDFAISMWLWFTVLFANFAEAVAEGRGKAQADALRKTRTETLAKLVVGDGSRNRTRRAICAKATSSASRPASSSRATATSSKARRRSTNRRSPASRRPSSARPAAIAARLPAARACSPIKSTCASTANPGETFLDRMIGLVEGAQRQKTPNEIALSILLAGLTIIFLIAVATLAPFSIYAGQHQSVTVLIALLVCLIPTTIGGLLSAIGIAGMDRVMQRNVLAMSGRAVEAAGDVDTLLLDKTGTITLGNRQATEIIPVDGVASLDAKRVRPTLVARRRDARRALDRHARASERASTNGGARRRDVRAVQRLHAHERARSQPTGSETPQGRAGCRRRVGARARRKADRRPRACKSNASRARAARRCCLRATRRSSASSTSKTSSSRT